MIRVSLRMAFFAVVVTALVGILLNVVATILFPNGIKGWSAYGILGGFVLVTGGIWLGGQRMFQRHFYRRMREYWENKVGRARILGEHTAVVSLFLLEQTISLEYALEQCPTRLLCVPLASQAMRDELCARAVRCYTCRPGEVGARVGARPVVPLRLTPQVNNGIRKDLEATIESIFSHDSRRMIDAAVHYLQEGRHCVALFVDAEHMTEPQLAEWLGTQDPDWCWRVLIMIAPAIEAELRRNAPEYPTTCAVATCTGCECPQVQQETEPPQVQIRVKQCADALVETLCRLRGDVNKTMGRRLLQRCALAFLLADDADPEAWLYHGALLDTGMIEEPALFAVVLEHLHELVEHAADGATVRGRRDRRAVWDYLLAEAVTQSGKSVAAAATPAQWRAWHDAPRHVYLRLFLDSLAEGGHLLAHLPASPYHRLIQAGWANGAALDATLLAEVAALLPSGQPVLAVSDQCALWPLLLASEAELAALRSLVGDLPASEKVAAVFACASPDRRLQALYDVITDDELYAYFNDGNGVPPTVPTELRQRQASAQVARLAVLMMLAPSASPVPDELGDQLRQVVTLRPVPVPMLTHMALDLARLEAICPRYHLTLRENVLYPQP
jgi:hypothetical protein